MGFSVAHPGLLVLGLLAPLLAVAVWIRMPPPLSRRRGRISLAIHLAVLLAVAGALSGLTLARTPSAQSVVAVVDRSASVMPSGDQERQDVVALQRGLTGADELGVVTTGQQALVEDPPSTASGAPAFTDFATAPNPDYTNLEAGLRLAGSILPTTTLRHVVVVSDGRQNLGDAVPEARTLRSAGVRVDVLPVAVPAGPEARVQAVQAPSRLASGASTQVRVLLNSNVTTTATLGVFVDQTPVYQAPVTLGTGDTTVPVSLPPATPGFHTVTAHIDPAQDTYAENNTGEAIIQVTGPPRVLVVEGSPGDGANVVGALKAASLSPQLVAPAGVPDSLPGLAGYQAVALVNVPASAFSATQMQVLRSGVRDLGIGLAAFGGPDALGPGGYAGTPLDAMLPVTAQIPQELRKPPVAVVLVLETMESPEGDVVERGAAKALIAQLTPQDYFGVTDGSTGLAVPLQRVTDKAKLEQTVENMSFGDPPSYSPYLADAASALAAQPSANKFIILAGDGDAQDDYPGEGHSLAAKGINVSAIGINVHASAPSMANLKSFAQAGGGNFYESDSASQLPQLLLQESQKSLKPWVVQGTFRPRLVTPSAVLGGIEPATLPGIDAYVASTPKPTAEVVLASPANDPVLATWRYGLGRAAAWTSDTSGRWTRSFLTSPDAGRLLANLVAWTLPSGEDSALSVQTAVAGDQGHVTVQLAASAPLPAGAQVVASVAGPDFRGVQVPLSVTAPGRYEGNFGAGQPGSYLVRVTVSSGGQVLHSAMAALAVSYSPEYQFLGTDLPFLQELAKAGGGVVLPDAGAAFGVALPPIPVSEPLAFLLLAIAVILIPVDIAARRLVLTRSDTAAWAEAVHPTAAPAPVEPTLAQLQGRLDRHQAARRSAQQPPEATSGEPEPGEGDLAARLLARRKKQS